jgi:hypothetical protein
VSKAVGADLNSVLLGALSDAPFVTSSRRANSQAVICVLSGSRGIGFAVTAPVRGESLRKTTVSAKSAPRLHRFFCSLLMPQVYCRSQPEDDVLGALEAMGLILPPEKVPEPVRFIAQMQDEQVRAMARDMRIRRPDAAQANFSSLFERCAESCGRPVTWIHDPARQIDWPYWLTPEQLALFALERHVEGRRGIEEWEATFNDARERLAQAGYAVVRDIIPGTFLNHIQDYYRRLVLNGYLRFGDSQSLRYNLNNEPFAQWLHHHTAALVAHAIPEPVKCSYSYIGCYVAGAVLERHTDREQCEYTLSMTIDATPSQAREDAWPLCLDTPDGSRVEAFLSPGDGLIFKGRELSHYRERLADGRTSRSIFLHYVPVGFTGKLD